MRTADSFGSRHDWLHYRDDLYLNQWRRQSLLAARVASRSISPGLLPYNDIVSTADMAVLRALDRADLSACHNIERWVYMTAMHGIRDAVRGLIGHRPSRRPRMYFTGDDHHDVIQPIPPANEEQNSVDGRDLLAASLARLQGVQRELFCLCHGQGLSIKAAARQLHIPLSSAWLLNRRILESLRQAFDPVLPEAV